MRKDVFSKKMCYICTVMEIKIEIPNRLYKDIETWCASQNKGIETYILSTLREDITIKKYGDLNEKIVKKTVIPQPEPHVENVEKTPKTEEVKVERTEKTVEEQPPVEKSEEKVAAAEKTDEVKKHRTLKTK